MSIDEWFTEQRSRIGMLKDPTLLSFDKSEWNVSDMEIINPSAAHKGILAHAESPSRVWSSVLMLQPLRKPHGVILLVSWKEADHRFRFLVQAKEEPGNDTPRRVVITATIQAGLSRLEAEQVPYVELLQSSQAVSVPQDGGMFYEKLNDIRVCILGEAVVVRDGFYVATLEEIRKKAKEGLVSEHLLQALGAFLILQYA